MLIKAVQRRLQEEEQQQGHEHFLPPASSLSYKKLYLAFQRRLCKNMGYTQIDWQDPYNPDERNPTITKDARALVFIVRIGNTNDPKTCALMEWDLKNLGTLVLDKTWFDNGDIKFPCLEGAPVDFDFYQFNHNDYYHIDKVGAFLTLHVVDVERYQVMTIIENSPPYYIALGSFPARHLNSGKFNYFNLPRIGLYDVDGSLVYHQFECTSSHRFVRSNLGVLSAESCDSVNIIFNLYDSINREYHTREHHRDSICNFLRAVMEKVREGGPMYSI